MEPGSYIVLAKASLISDGGEFASCRINVVRAGSSFDLDAVRVPTVKPSFGLPGAWGEVSMVGLVGSPSANVELGLYCAGDGVSASNIRLIAAKVNRLVGTDAP